MNSIYRAYGLWLGADRVIPGLIRGSDDSRVDVHVRLGSEPAGRKDELPNELFVRESRNDTEHGRAESIALPRNGGDGYRLRFADGTVFIVDGCGSHIWARWPEELTLEDTVVYLLGPVLAFVLRLRGSTCLHASAFVNDGGAVALLGPSGAGKSTIAASFAGRGFPVICDDTLALEERNGRVIAQPGYPRLRLWPDATTILDDVPRWLPKLTPNWDKRYLDLQHERYRHARDAMPLVAIYLIDWRRQDPTTPFVSPLNASAGLLSLITNIRSDCYPDKQSHRREFDMIGRLARDIPIRRIAARTGSRSLGGLCDSILSDLHCVSDESMTTRETVCTI